MFKKTFLLLVFLFFSMETFPQCAMCKAVAESSIGEGKSIVSGLNTGILYLMALPYFLLLLFGTAWFFVRKEQANLK